MKYLLLISSIVSLNSLGQINSTTLDFNNVSAKVTDGGVLFKDFQNSIPAYEIPKGSGSQAIFASAFWFGAMDEGGQLHLSGTRFYGNFDIFSGPIADSGMYTSTNYISEYSPAFWSVNKSDITNHILNWNQPGYSVPFSILNWPGNGDTSIGVAEQLAPYVDMNNNGIYEPQLGDYPRIRGDEVVYIILNDVAKPHNGTGGAPLGIEVHLMLYQFASDDYLNNTTFVQARVFNRGNIAYPDFRTSFFADGDLGNFVDDYVGVDSLRELIFMYNSDAFDETVGPVVGYGTNPPAIGITSLSTPMIGAGYSLSTGPNAQLDPTSAADYWNYMNNKWRYGDPWVYGGNGFPGSIGSTSYPTNFVFNGDPNDSTQWSEASENNPQGDRRMIMNLSGVPLAPGQQICYDFAILYGQGTGPFGSIVDLGGIADQVKIFFSDQNFMCESELVRNEELTLLETSIYPNPSSGKFHISFHQPVDHFTITVLDLAGKVVYVGQFDNRQEVELNMEEQKGVYIVRVESNVGLAVERVLIE